LLADDLLSEISNAHTQQPDGQLAPLRDPLRDGVAALLPDLVAALAPATGAYHEIWLDGDLVAGSAMPPGEEEPLYGEQYLPRKFKTAIGLEGDNCVDVHANDLGLVAYRDAASGGLGGFNVLGGGGLGRTRNKPETFATVAVPMASVVAE